MFSKIQVEYLLKNYVIFFGGEGRSSKDYIGLQGERGRSSKDNIGLQGGGGGGVKGVQKRIT